MVNIIDRSNWLYVSVTPNEEESHNLDDFVAGDTVDQDSTYQQDFVPPTQDPTHQGPA